MTRVMRRMRKYLLVVACIALVAGLAIGGTIAWLAAKSDEVVNTFTVGNIDIKLEEHDYNPDNNSLEDGVPEDGEETETEVLASDNKNDDYKIIPGVDLPKDPFVTVKKGSEACYLFVKIEEVNWPTADNGKIAWEQATGWTQLTTEPNGEGENVNGVFYRKVDAVPATVEKDPTYPVLKDNQIIVGDDLTKYEVDQIIKGLGTEGKFSLKITAYAIQQAQMTDECDAWTKISAITLAEWHDNTANENDFTPNSNQPAPTNP